MSSSSQTSKSSGPTAPVYLVDGLEGYQFLIGRAPTRHPGIRRLYYDYPNSRANLYSGSPSLKTLVETCRGNVDVIAAQLSLYTEIEGLDTTWANCEEATLEAIPAVDADSSEPYCFWDSSRATVQALGNPANFIHPVRMEPEDSIPVPAMLLAAMMNMLGGGRIQLDFSDIQVAMDTLNNSSFFMSKADNPLKVVLELRERK